ncbi:MAG TPA: 30S ribosomal protein S17 [Devosia sp.]|nr:30S ribosomal protein S17 [Devosia sp.]
MSEATQTELETRGERKVREGLVVSDKMDKTVVVAVEDRFKHPMYGKVVRRTSRLKAHDEDNTCGTGDRVLLMETAIVELGSYKSEVELISALGEAATPAAAANDR